MAGEEKEEKKEQAPAETKKLPVKIIIIALAVVLVLAGAAAGYFVFAGHKRIEAEFRGVANPSVRIRNRKGLLHPQRLRARTD